MRVPGILILLTGLSVLPVAGVAQEAAPADQTSPDNTKINKRDRNSTEATADQQKEDKTDLELARKIRRSIVADKSLSTYAHNIKVIAQNGTVTLKGPVHTDDEKKAIEQKAAAIAGSDKVNNELSVTGAQ